MGSLKNDPHNHGSGSGQSLEIFLFSNGQHDSPPRKYNVGVNDNWNTTLNFLAKSQNGSDHNIELYTTEGRRIENTQELANGTAYVAVEPPQAFIPSGYDDYLMKASRSREKRLEKLTENTKFKNQDKNNCKHKTQEEIVDGTNIKIIQDITICPTSRTTVEEQVVNTSKNKSDTADVKTANPIGRMGNKQMQKKYNSLPQPNFHTINKNANNITPPIKKRNMFSKTDTTKKKVDISSIQKTKTGPNNTFVKSKSKTDIAGTIRIISDKQNHTEAVGAYDLLKHKDEPVIPEINAIGYKETPNMKIDSTFTEQHLLLPVAQEKDLPDSELIIPINTPSKTGSLSNGRKSITAPYEDVKLVHERLSNSPLSEGPLANLPTEIDRTEINKTEIINVTHGLLKKNAIIFGNQTGDSNFTIYVKPSDVGNLKLNIEVKYVSDSMLDTKNVYHVKSTTTLANAVKADYKVFSKEGSQTKHYREAQILTEPWLGGGLQHVPVPLPQTTNEQGVVCQCHCCSYPRTEGEGVAPVYVDNNNYFILLPPEDLQAQLLSCACKLKTNQEVNHEMSNNHETPKLNNHIVKLDGETNLIDPRYLNKISSSCKLKNIQDRIMDKKQSFSVNEIIGEDTKHGLCCNCPVQKPKSKSDVAQNLVPESPVSDREDANRSDLVNKEDTRVNKVLPTQKEAFTQTDWSGLVLEVRPRENGSYEFHIPSLKVLKMSNALY